MIFLREGDDNSNGTYQINVPSFQNSCALVPFSPIQHRPFYRHRDTLLMTALLDPFAASCSGRARLEPHSVRIELYVYHPTLKEYE